MDTRLPIPILIKGEEKFLDGPEIIDLDEQVSSEDIILEWCTRVRLKFKSFFVADTERNLDTLMKWYIQFFKEEAMHIDDCSTLKMAVTKHLQFFKMVFSELDCPFVDNYLDNMEDILALYCDLEANDLPKKQKGSSYGSTLKTIGRKLIDTFNFFLMCKEERVHHVLMKMRLTSSEESTDLLNFLYGKLLTKRPTTNKSDLAFCRTYILYQKWKTIQKPELWQQMDSIMYEQFDRTPDSLKTNETLNQILFPRNESVLNVLTHISNNYTMMSEEYFKFLRSQNIQEDSLVPLDVINVDLDEQSSDESKDGDHEDFDRAYNEYVASLAATDGAAPERPDAAADDDECIIVGVGTIDFGQSNSDLVCEISDDEDIIDIVFFQPKQEPPREIRKEKPASPPPSFLDSIDISAPPAPPPPPASPIIFTAVTPPPSKGSFSSPSDVDSPAPCRPRARRRAARRRVGRAPGAALKQRAARRRAARRRYLLGRKTQAGDRDEQVEERVEKTNLTVESTKKIVNHIETQTDFPLPTADEASEQVEPAGDAGKDAEEEVYEGGLVTPPASEHRRDADLVVAAETNVYAAILVSDSSPSSSDVAPAPGHPAGAGSGDYYASPDVSSTSHDHPHDAKSGVEEGAAEEEEGSPPPVATPEYAEVCDGVSRLPVAPAKWTYRDFDKFQEELNAGGKKSAGAGVVHSKWDTLIENHGLEDNFLSGSIKKVNGCVNPYKDFDLFDDRPPAPAEAPAASPEPRGALNDSTSQTSSSGIPSPPYEGMCDFENYLTSYKAASGAATEGFKAPKGVVRRAESEWADPKIIKPKTPGKKTLAFARQEAVDAAHPPLLHQPRAIPSSAVQGILKKPTRRAPRASRRLVSAASLRHHRVSPDDPCLRAEPVVVVEKIGQGEIRRWETISAISRKVRQQREQTRYMLSTSLCRVDYDKSTMSLNENDRIQYNTQEAGAPSTDADPVKLEGKPDIREHFTCCASLAADVARLAVAEQRAAVSPSPHPNPFAAQRLPAAVPLLEEFERTLEAEGVAKHAALPSDLEGLALSQFTPSPPPLDLQGGGLESLEYAELPRLLPLKKRKLSVANSPKLEEDFLGPDLVEEIIKRARAERTDREDISYPAKPAISIAEIQERLEPLPRAFKTPAEKKEMPAAVTQQQQQKIVTEQYNNHTYNNPTINYHMNNVPYSFFGSLSYFPPILLPVNSTATFDVNLVNNAQQQQPPEDVIGRSPRREKRSKRKKKE